MEFFDTFPFTKLQGKNRGLDWVIQKIVSFQKEIDKIPEYIAEYNPEESEHVKSRNNPHEVTAEQVGARPNTWMPTAEEVGARPADWLPTLEEIGITGGGGGDAYAHIADKNNPHRVTAEQVGARPNTWMPTAEDVGARPDTWMPTAEDVGARPDTWMPTAEDVGATSFEYVKKAAPRNLLDNSDFRNPVNQRGQTSYTGEGYTIDRWQSINTGNIITVLDGGIHFQSTELGVLRQYLDVGDRYANKMMTIAVKFTDETIRCASGKMVSGSDTILVASFQGINGRCELYKLNGMTVVQLGVENSSVSVEWVALYEGEYTAETLPEYQPKGYAVELAECQRYFYATVKRVIMNGYFSNSGKEVIVGCIPELGKMRVDPSISTTGNVIVRTLDGYAKADGFTSSSGGSVSLLSDLTMYYKCNIKLVFASAATDVNNSAGSVVFTEPVFFSADL